MLPQHGQKRSHATFMSETGGPPPRHQPAFHQQAACVPTQQHGGPQAPSGHNHDELTRNDQPSRHMPQQLQHQQLHYPPFQHSQHPNPQHPQLQHPQLQHPQLQHPQLQHQQPQHQQSYHPHFQQRQLQPQELQYRQQFLCAGNAMPYTGHVQGDYPPHHVFANMQPSPRPGPQTQVVDRWLQTRPHLRRHEDPRDLHLPKFRRENTERVPWMHPRNGSAKTQPEASRMPLRQDPTSTETRADLGSVESASCQRTNAATYELSDSGSTITRLECLRAPQRQDTSGAGTRAGSVGVEPVPHQRTDTATPVSPDSVSAITHPEDLCVPQRGRRVDAEPIADGGSGHNTDSTHAAEPVCDIESDYETQPVPDAESVHESVHAEPAAEQPPSPGSSNVHDGCASRHTNDQECLVDQMVCGLWANNMPGFLGTQIYGEVPYMKKYFSDLVTEAEAITKRQMAHWHQEDAEKAKDN